MIDPVLSSVRGEGKVGLGFSIDFVVEVEENAADNLCDDGTCRLGENVVV